MTDVLVMGAGAVGAYFGACLQRAGLQVAYIARGRNLETLASRGLRITGAMGAFTLDRVRAGEGPAAFPRAELVLLCVKSYDLHAACEAVGDAGDLFLTLQNGVDAPFVAREILGDRVIAGTTGDRCRPSRAGARPPHVELRVDLFR